jgi:hypothetical protein
MKKKTKRLCERKIEQAMKPLSHRLAIRVSDTDYFKLCELRLALHLPSDAATIRALVRLHHSHATDALRRARRDPHHQERIRALANHRQLEMWEGRQCR